MTCPGLGILPEARHVICEPLGAGPVVNDGCAAFAVRKSPVDDELAEGTSLCLDVSVAISGDVAPSTAVEDFGSSARASNPRRLPVKPSGGFHVVLLLESGEIIISQSEASQAQWLWAKRRPLRLQRLIYINTGILCQAILRKSQ